MANIAAILKKEGNIVSGVDVSEHFPTDSVLDASGIAVSHFEIGALPEDVDTVIYSAAHGGRGNKFVQEAFQKGKTVLHQVELIARLMTAYRSRIAVAGCHGKTTTSSLLSYSLLQLKVNPTYLIGAPSFSGYPGSSLGGNEYFVIEADEYAIDPPADKTPKFHLLPATHAIVTNVDFDHPDVYADLAETQNVFERFLKETHQRNPARTLVLCADDAPLMQVADRLDSSWYVTYGTSQSAQYRISDIQHTSELSLFTLNSPEGEVGTFSTKIPGDKNILNAAGVVVMLTLLGFAPENIQSAIAGFSGARRRFEQVISLNDITVIDDYAHHPNELAAIVNAARSRYPDRKIILLFQPHTFSRTSALQSAFIEAFGMADSTILLPIFASAREHKPAEKPITSARLAEEANSQGKTSVWSAEDETELRRLLQEQLKSKTVVLMAGAGDVYRYQPLVEAVIAGKAV